MYISRIVPIVRRIVRRAWHNLLRILPPVVELRDEDGKKKKYYVMLAHPPADALMPVPEDGAEGNESVKRALR